jgi:hypothetical protein
MEIDPNSYRPLEISPIQSDPTIIEKLLNTNDVLFQIEHEFRGEVYDDATESYIKAGKTWMNDDGVRETISFIRPFFNKVVLSGNYDKPQINNICRRAMEAYIDMLFIHSEEYGIDENDLQPIVIKVGEIIYSALSSAGEGGLRNLMFKSISEKRVYGISNDAQKPGLSNGFGLLSRR